jgi:Protein of unknown function (DUF3618)
MSTHEELQADVEQTRQQLSQTVDQLAHKADVKRVWLQYRVPITLFAVALALALFGRSGWSRNDTA